MQPIFHGVESLGISHIWKEKYYNVCLICGYAVEADAAGWHGEQGESRIQSVIRWEDQRAVDCLQFPPRNQLCKRKWRFPRLRFVLWARRIHKLECHPLRRSTNTWLMYIARVEAGLMAPNKCWNKKTKKHLPLVCLTNNFKSIW